MAWVAPAIGAIGSWWGALGAGTQAAIGMAAGSAAGAGISKMMEPDMPDMRSMPKTPQQAPAGPDDETRQINQRRLAQQRARQQTGRASTFLTDQSGTLG